MKETVAQTIKNSPKDPGVYIFRGQKGVLYVGKAANLRARLKSYLKITDLKTESLHQEAEELECRPLRSEIEALIEESRLIKELKPKYNVVLRDDKSYSYVAFTRETFPKVLVTHKHSKLVANRYSLTPSLIGPFTDSGSLRLVLKLLRRRFPYCTCFEKHLRDCLNAQIGKCPGFCCNKNLTMSKELIAGYKRTIRKIKMILKGQSRKVLDSISDEKERAALEAIFAHQPYMETGAAKKKTDPAVFPEGTKVECYDNSNFAGKEAVGALTGLVKINGEWRSDKGAYRKFRIKWTPKRDDPRMIGELIARRLNHPEWPYPQLIVIDGGLTQYRAAKMALETARASRPKPYTLNAIRIVSFAKPNKLVYGLKDYDAPTPAETLPKEFQEMLEMAIYQTHNFVIRYHREVRAKEFIPRS